MAVFPELTLDQMLSDVIVQLVMRRDRVTESEVRELMAGVQRGRSARPNVCGSPTSLQRAA